MNPQVTPKRGSRVIVKADSIGIIPKPIQDELGNVRFEVNIVKEHWNR